jgi:hypothetical protein
MDKGGFKMAFGERSKEELEREIKGIKVDPKEYEKEESITEIAGLDKDDILGRVYPNKAAKEEK